jgi:mannose-6-phosphate isomerase-like protein (cupin superfamily)
MSRRSIAGALAFGALLLLPVMASDHPVTHISGNETRAAFEKGTPLLENALYKVHASRREAPGQAEVHVRDTDIIYVLEGTATIVTGGTAVSTKGVAQDELRGSSIEGGKTTYLAKGDVLVVPNGTAHQFTDVSKPFLYYVVKVTSASSAAEAGLQPRVAR